ncbi:sulfatase family protein [Cerasicoccus arenae]|uniref:Sulfatase n=1 Tax=Cerasicoccus arenae TaxID=424488 RepID=A0A8J3GFA9_9BACT|nr:sulfatase-like hydrolase/transferase [Cerasicoccus arenae]MBK1858363.1 sulfatase-like hydrolase/transferase [Cerasicoccus arenae]GHC09825.1 sulfatase [Cerasicoccus arenae]
MKPNILWICTDEQRYDSLGCTGNPHAVTPHLDALAAEGAIYHRFITANPVCMPSRASFFTGQMPSRHGVVTNGVGLPNRDLVPASPTSRNMPQRESHANTLPELLAAAGYHTRSIGKLHLCPTRGAPELNHPENDWLWKEGKFDDWHGPYFGFEHVDLTLNHGERNIGGHYRKWLREVAPEVEALLNKRIENYPAPEIDTLYPGRIPEEYHHSTWVGQKTADFLSSDEAKEKPFFLWMSFPDPHQPFTPPASLAEEFSKHDYLVPTATVEDLADKPSAWPKESMPCIKNQPENIGTVRRYTDAQNHLIDRAVGQAIKALKANGLWENTIVIFTSDHGDYLGDYGRIRKNELPCNALNHVPCIVHDPLGKLPKTTDMAVSGVDMFPTICELAGVEITHSIDGQSLLQGDPDQRRALVQCMSEEFPPSFTIYDREYRLTWFPGQDEWECYAHQNDPYERKNIIAEFRLTERFKELREELMVRHLSALHPRIGRFSCW